MTETDANIRRCARFARHQAKWAGQLTHPCCSDSPSKGGSQTATRLRATGYSLVEEVDWQ